MSIPDKTLAGTPAWQLIPNISLMLEGSSHSRGPYEMSTSQGTAIYDDAPLRGFLSLITRENIPLNKYSSQEKPAGFGFKNRFQGNLVCKLGTSL